MSSTYGIFQKLIDIMVMVIPHGPLARYVKLWVAHAPGMPGTFFPPLTSKGNHYIAIPACITSRASRTCRDACRDRLPTVAGKTFPAFSAHAQPAILRIWQEAHGMVYPYDIFISGYTQSILKRPLSLHAMCWPAHPGHGASCRQYLHIIRQRNCRTLLDNKIVDYSDVVRAAPV